MPEIKCISVDVLIEKLKEIQSYHKPDGSDRDQGIYDACALIGAFALENSSDMVSRSRYNRAVETMLAHGIVVRDEL